MSDNTAVAAVWDGPVERFRIVELPLPMLAPGEVLVETRAVTLCGSDLHTITGDRDTPVPTVLGHEMVGDVLDARGPVETYDGRPVEPGMRVTWTVGASCGSCARCARGLPQKCVKLRKYGHAAMDEVWQLNGGLASHCHLLPGTGIVSVPDTLADEVSAPANCATATVISAIRRLAVAAGDLVVVQGCGMLGLTAIAYLRSLGVQAIVASDIDAPRRALAERLGACEVAPPDELRDIVLERSSGEGADVVIDMSGSTPAVRCALDLLAVGGRLGLVGSVFPAPAVALSPEAVVRRLLTVTGTHNYAPVDLAEAVVFLDRFADRGLFRELVPDIFALHQLDQAVAYARERRPPRVAVDPRRRLLAGRESDDIR